MYIRTYIHTVLDEVAKYVGLTGRVYVCLCTHIHTYIQFGRELDEVGKYVGLMGHTRDQAISVGIANALLGTSIHVAANVSLACVLGMYAWMYVCMYAIIMLVCGCLICE